MKKLIALMLVLAMAATMMAACGKKDQTPETTAANETTAAPETTGAAETTVPTEETIADETAAPTMGEVTMDSPVADIVSKVMEANPVEFMAGFFPTDLTDTSEEGLWAITSTTGLQNGEKISDLAVYEPMMGSMAFSLVMVRVNEGVDAKEVAQEMHDNIDPRKWICVEADDLQVVGSGDVVMLIMVDSSLELPSQSFVDAFKTVCGELDFTI